jgi:hypothetical protein
VCDKIEISVKDNGMGISKSLVDKIFQPFFTTKPIGQGTGLGLSLSYDIIKAHGGELKLSQLPAIIIANMRSQTKVYLSASFNHFGGLFIATLEPLSQENFNILLRFAKVFDQTYTRFNDLKLAESQAREAKIEAALERVQESFFSYA